MDLARWLMTTAAMAVAGLPILWLLRGARARRVRAWPGPARAVGHGADGAPTTIEGVLRVEQPVRTTVPPGAETAERPSPDAVTDGPPVRAVLVGTVAVSLEGPVEVLVGAEESASNGAVTRTLRD